MTQVNAQTYKVPVPVPLDVTVSAFVHLKKQSAGSPKGDVVYVHGATFPSDLSVFYRFDGKSWADALNAAGFNVWGFDFVGYGHSSRYGQELTQPRGTAQEALPQLLAAVATRSKPERRAQGTFTRSFLGQCGGSTSCGCTANVV